jgi:hypothetical protein
MVVANTPIHRKEAPTMCHSNQERLRQQVQFLRRQFLQDGDLPFTNVLTEEGIAQALTALTGWLDRVFSPLVTLWVFNVRQGGPTGSPSPSGGWRWKRTATRSADILRLRAPPSANSSCLFATHLSSTLRRPLSFSRFHALIGNERNGLQHRDTNRIMPSPPLFRPQRPEKRGKSEIR